MQQVLIADIHGASRTVFQVLGKGADEVSGGLFCNCIGEQQVAEEVFVIEKVPSKVNLEWITPR